MNWIELSKAGVFTTIGSLLAFFLAPPIQDMNAQRDACRVLVQAESLALAFMRNPDRIQGNYQKDLLTVVDAQVHIVNQKALEMQGSAGTGVRPGPGIAAIKEFQAFANTKDVNYTPQPGQISPKHEAMIAAVYAGCKRQYSSLDSVFRNVFDLW